MKILTEDSIFEKTPSVATIGFFDGVHRGHQFLISQVRRIANQRGLSSLLITFPIPPRKVLQPDFTPQLLTTPEEKRDLLASTGADACLFLNFTLELSRLTAREFMQLLHDRYGVEVLVIGHDHRFGHRKEEGFEDYVRYGEEMGMEVLQADVFRQEGQNVSSSAIRRLLQDRLPEQAQEYLGYPYRYTGKVGYGHQIGRTLGFPTANLTPVNPYKLLPAEGIYAVYVWVHGNRYRGMLDIGYRPTLQNGDERTVEVNILDFNQDIYGEEITMEFKYYMREDIKFDTVEELIVQLEEDRRTTLRLLSDS